MNLCSKASKSTKVKETLNRLPSPLYLKLQYKIITGKTLNLKNPVTFDEKIQKLKLLDRNPLLTVCADKVRAREYVCSCGLTHILNDMYGVYDCPGEIDFSVLPSEVFFKCNHRSGANIIYKQGEAFDQEQFKKEFTAYLKENYYFYAREWCYKNIQPKILAERVLRDKNGNLPTDYKFFCFEGEAKIVSVEMEKCTEGGRHTKVNYRNMYDTDFNLLPVKDTRENKDVDKIKKPLNFDLMLEYAALLSKPFAHCRVDLFNVDGHIYFGEMTFYHGSGYNQITPYEWEVKLGSWLNLDSPKIVKTNESEM